jgi:hypothetical protein
MINKSKYILLILLLASVIYDTSAQNSQVLYYMNLPQKHLLNPALRPSNSVYIGLPVLSGINVNLNNNFISFQDVLMKSAVGDSVISIFHPDYDINRFLPKIKDINSFETQTLVQLFGLGFNAGKDLYIFFDVNERIETNFAFPGDILRLGLLGNEQFVGNKINLSGFGADIRSYTEAGLGFSKNFLDNLRIGIKGKLLFGIGAATIDNNALGITVNEDYSHVFEADLTVNVSAPLIYKEDPEGNIESIEFDSTRFNTKTEIIDYFLSAQNLGLGIDIGAEYKITEKLAISASITDLGYIKWRRDAKNLKADSRFEFSGIDMVDVYDRDITLDSLGNEYLDSLSNSFNYNNTAIPFKTMLPVGFSAGGSYNLTKSVSVGVLSYTRIIGKQIREALTLSANVNFNNALSFSLAYTAANHRYDNLGAGLALRAGCFQFYLLSDNIPVRMNKIQFTTSDDPDGPSGPQPAKTRNHQIWIPENLQTLQIRLGMNFSFGNKVKKKTDKPMFSPDDNIIPEK